jgi:GNAT superfamily N-acetyltransferase
VPPTFRVPQGYALERLDPEHHLRTGFACGKDALDSYLRTQAAQQQSRYLSATHVLIHSDSALEAERHVLGYVTLVSTEIPLLGSPASLKKSTNKPQLPVLLLARMASDQQHRGKRLGESLLQFAIFSAWEMNQNSGCVALIVDSKDLDAKQFYLKYGFEVFPEQSMRLFIGMSTIEKL